MYQQAISRQTPGCIVFLLDRSESMREPWAGSGMTLAEGAAQAINRILFDLCVRSTKEQGAPMRPYFYIAAFTYGLRMSDQREGVESGWGGPMAGRGIVPLPELAGNPIAVRQVPSVDRMPAARLPEWIAPAHGHRTPMCQAIAEAGAHIYDWTQQFSDSFPPIIINITDGMVTDSPYQDADLRTWAQRLTGIATRDGAAILLTVYLSPAKASSVWFPATAQALPPPGPDLFAISSPLPPNLIDNARGQGISVPPGARGLVFNADLSMLTKFLEIGTRFDVSDR